MLDNYTLRSPYDALVVARNLQLGAMPVPGQVVFTLVDPATIWVLSYVDERLAGGIALGQPAEITLRSEPGRHHHGHVARIEIQSDAVNEERLVEVAFDDIPRDIHLAEQAEVVITTGSLDRAVLVPQTAVSGLHGGQGTVWTAEDDKLARRDVTFGAPLLGGRLPINPSGGLIGAGHPVGATGVRMVLDVHRQVTGNAGGYQVDGASVGATLNIGGSTTSVVSFVLRAESPRS